MSLKAVYYNEKSPAYIGSIKKLDNAVSNVQLFRNKIKNRQKTVKKWLSGEETYTLHKPVWKNFWRNHYNVLGIDRLWEADLIDLSALKRENDGHTFILTVIDVFSKYAFAYPLKSKTSGAVVRGFKHIIDTSKRTPKILQSDKGKEFKNKYLKEFLKSRGIAQQFPLTISRHKAAVVERFNRTIQSYIRKYFTSQGMHTKHHRYIHILPKLIYLYNHSNHRTIKMKPADVNERNVKYVYENTRSAYRSDKPRMNIYTQPIELGDYVRIARRKPRFEPGYTVNWSTQVFRVTNIIRKNPYFLYKVKDLDGHPIHEKFYLQELQVVTYKKR